MGLTTGLKKLDLRRSFGVDGRTCRLSTVRSESDGREALRGGGNCASSGASLWVGLVRSVSTLTSC